MCTNVCCCNLRICSQCYNQFLNDSITTIIPVYKADFERADDVAGLRNKTTGDLEVMEENEDLSDDDDTNRNDGIDNGLDRSIQNDDDADAEALMEQFIVTSVQDTTLNQIGDNLNSNEGFLLQMQVKS